MEEKAEPINQNFNRREKERKKVSRLSEQEDGRKKKK